MSSDFAENYQVLEELGRGSFGVVYKGIDRSTGEIIDLESSNDEIDEIQAEIAVLSTCFSAYVTQYKGSFLRGHKLWIVMEYMGGGSCLDLVRARSFYKSLTGPVELTWSQLKPDNFSEAQIAIVSRELLHGIHYLHSEGKIHRDIKAANVLLSETGKVKLADFGVAAQLTSIKSQRNTFVGTPFWMAPEVIQQDGYNSKADIWSLGITAMELANGEPPLCSIHPMKVIFHIPKNAPPRLEGNFSRDFKDFIAQCLTKDYERRPSAQELLKHRFIRSAGKVEALQELIARREMWDATQNRQKHPIYYQETLQTITAKSDDHEWVFDTVKSAAPPPSSRPTVRRGRRPSSMVLAEDGMRKLDLSEGPLSLSSPAVDTVRKATVRRAPSEAQPDSMRSAGSPRQTTAPRKPLQTDMSFGNAGSTMRLFRRVPSGGTSTSARSGSSEDTCVDENIPPSIVSPVEPYGKEAVLGRRLYLKAIDPTLAELHAQTSTLQKREALAKLSDAFAALDAIDPEGVHHVVSNLIGCVSQDKKLNATLLPHNADVLLEDVGQGTIVKSPHPAINANANANTPKLVLSSNNPHLKSHRRRQSDTPTPKPSDKNNDKDGALEDRFPGREPQVGMEHCKQLSDALYQRWVNNLRVRWPAV
ncbi:hypothetical protein CDD82_5773 [Ophiocordyceps australis]|uniref:non-specific serine/threonine protein kinase n=1 Tax=Ophiocordyceps australis TaxID=1399860 RepID=A0A2C5XHS2_9HYPO|nr:hypothetical protein CDD82_5773 [Ophiocordyceps australis]